MRNGEKGSINPPSPLQEHAARVKDQSAELQAINETLDILTGDEARDQFKKSLKPSSFLQLKKKSSLTVRSRAATVLKRAALVHGADELNLMATTVQLDAFEEVNTMIANLVKELKQKKADEVGGSCEGFCRAPLLRLRTLSCNVSSCVLFTESSQNVRSVSDS